jgi:hypothetical protein
MRSRHAQQRADSSTNATTEPNLSPAALALLLLMARERKPLMVCDAQKKLKAEGVSASAQAVRDAFVELWRHGLIAKREEFN